MIYKGKIRATTKRITRKSPQPTPQHLNQSRNCPNLRFQNVLVALLVSLNHAKGNARKFGQFLLGKMGLLLYDFQG